MKNGLNILIRIIEISFILIFLLSVIFHRLVSYGINQGIGQLEIIRNARPLEEVMNDASVPDSVKSKLRFIEEVKKFAVDSLGLKQSDNYTTYYDQHDKAILWVLSASEKFHLKPYEWKFPIVGTVGYKGFFKFEKGKKEEQELAEKNFDTDLSPTSAWSTLGWFHDPVLSNFLRRNKGQIAELIIHEMTHTTYYAKSSVDINENLASAIGETGAETFLKSKYGTTSAELKAYLDEREDYNLFADHLLRGTGQLDSLYRAIENKSNSEKDTLKKHMILKIISSLDTVSFHNPRYKSRFDKDHLPNNSYFLSFVRYDSKKEEMKRELAVKFNGNILLFLDEIKKQRTGESENR